MSKQELIDEFAVLIDNIENTVEELTKYQIIQVSYETELLKAIKKHLNEVDDYVGSRLKTIQK